MISQFYLKKSWTQFKKSRKDNKMKITVKAHEYYVRQNVKNFGIIRMNRCYHCDKRMIRVRYKCNKTFENQFQKLNKRRPTEFPFKHNFKWSGFQVDRA